MIRLLIGYFVAVLYAVIRPHGKSVARIKKAGYFPVVVHSLPAKELDRILAYFLKKDILRYLDLSFDDAWATLSESIEVIEKYNVKVRVFVAPGQVLRGNIWTHEAQMLKIDGRIWRKWYHLDEKSRYDELSRYGSVKKRTLLSKDDIISLSRHPLVTIENHTWSHLSAPHRPAEEVFEEICRTQEELFLWTGRRCRSLAWPFGRGTAKLDERLRKELNLEVFYTNQGFERGMSRNMIREGVSVRENIARVLCSWPKVGQTL
jgi:peptidoglycan/xylan/chitin deacetylase (PgdA/CDA1 family)